MKDYSKPPYYLGDAVWALNAVIKSIGEPTIRPMDLKDGIGLKTVCQHIHVVASYLGLELKEIKGLIQTEIAVHEVVKGVVSEKIISEEELEKLIYSEEDSFFESSY